MPGEYRVAGADGADVNMGHAISVSVTQTQIEVASQCVTPSWTYRYVNGQLQTRITPEPICERNHNPAETAVLAVFDDPQTILRTPENGIFIEGGEHSITLFSQ